MYVTVSRAARCFSCIVNLCGIVPLCLLPGKQTNLWDETSLFCLLFSVWEICFVIIQRMATILWPLETASMSDGSKSTFLCLKPWFSRVQIYQSVVWRSFLLMTYFKIIRAASMQFLFRNALGVFATKWNLLCSHQLNDFGYYAWIIFVCSLIIFWIFGIFCSV